MLAVRSYTLDPMTRPEALLAIQKMHETRAVTKESIVAWYCVYSLKLPRMKPERSESDLVRTVSLWMTLTDQGCSPKFPFDYRADIQLSTIPGNDDTKHDVLWLISFLLIVGGLITSFFVWKLGVGIVIFGLFLQVLSYKLKGGAANPDLMVPGSLLYENEGRRVIDWIKKQS